MGFWREAEVAVSNLLPLGVELTVFPGCVLVIYLLRRV